MKKLPNNLIPINAIQPMEISMNKSYEVAEGIRIRVTLADHLLHGRVFTLAAVKDVSVKVGEWLEKLGYEELDAALCRALFKTNVLPLRENLADGYAYLGKESF